MLTFLLSSWFARYANAMIKKKDDNDDKKYGPYIYVHILKSRLISPLAPGSFCWSGFGSGVGDGDALRVVGFLVHFSAWLQDAHKIIIIAASSPPHIVHFTYVQFAYFFQAYRILFA